MKKPTNTPIYKEIRNIILAQIADGTLRPGQCLPSERDMCQLYNTSRMTVRQAVNELEMQGRLYSVQGKGTFVATSKVEQPFISLTGFSDDMRNRGMNPGSKVLGCSVIGADNELANKLRLPLGEKVISLERLRLADGAPMALEHSCMNYHYAQKIMEYNLENASLYHILENELGLKLKKGKQYMEVSRINKVQAQQLDVPANSYGLSIERHTYIEGGIPLEIVYSIYRGDLFRFYIELGER